MILTKEDYTNIEIAVAQFIEIERDMYEDQKEGERTETNLERADKILSMQDTLVKVLTNIRIMGS